MASAQKTVVTFSPEESDRNTHEYVSRCEVTKRLAELLGFDFAGEYDAKLINGADTYFVPRHTLLQDEAESLGIHSENDVFGGVVPHHFVATKAITHATVSDHARAPHGWSHALGGRLNGVVLPGFTAFSESDVANAGRLLLRVGCVRIKPAHHLGGLGQKLATNESELDQVVIGLDKDDLYEHGVVLEQNLEAPTTYSIGEVHLRDRRIAYYGTQRTTTNNGGDEVYGGTDLHIIVGDIGDLLESDLPASVRLAITQAKHYDDVVAEEFPEFYASRRNYDVVQGMDEKGKLLSGVLEQSWRLGGATAAELAAFRAFDVDRDLRSVHASTYEIYSPKDAAPIDADVYFDGDDPIVGRLRKYCLIANDGN